MTGNAGLTVKETLDEVPPAVTTVTLTVPVLVSRLAGTAAVSWVELTYVVASAVLPHLTTVAKLPER